MQQLQKYNKQHKQHCTLNIALPHTSHIALHQIIIIIVNYLNQMYINVNATH